MLSSVDTIWVLLGAVLVFFMQAGFAMVETGFTRAKNAGNIIMKNLMDFAIGTPLFWLTGFGIMFGGAGAFIGGFDPLVRGDYSGILPAGVPLPAYLIFQTVFCATAATIVSGAMAERTKFYFLLYLQRCYQRSGLSCIGTLDLGRRLAGPDGVSRFRGIHSCPYVRRGCSPDWSQDTGTAYRKVH